MSSVRRGIRNTPSKLFDYYKGDTVIDLTFNSSGSIINAGKYGATVTTPRGSSIVNSGIVDQYGFDLNLNCYIYVSPYSTLVSPIVPGRTVEAWFIPRSYSADCSIYGQDLYGKNFDSSLAFMLTANNGQMKTATNRTTDIYAPQATKGSFTGRAALLDTYGKLTHAALTKEGSGINLWLNGVKQGSGKTMGVSDSSNPFTVGCNGHNNPNAFFDGVLLRFRITNACRYTGNFTPDHPIDWKRY